MIVRTGADAHGGELTAAEKRRGLRVLLATTFLTWGGFFAVIPLIAVHYVDGLGWAAGSVGLVLAVRQFLQQSSTMFFGAVADRFGAKWLICGGLAIRVVGFGMMAWADSLLVLMISAIITAIGGGLFEAPTSAAIATFTDESNRRHYYSTVGVIGGLGTAIGVLSGALLIRADFGLVAKGTGLVFFIAFVLAAIYLPPVQVATARIGVLKGISFAMSDRIFVRYVALLIGFYFVNTQFNLALVLRATNVAGTESAVAWIYLINAGLITLLGYPLPRLFERRATAYDMLLLGTALIVLGMAAVAVSVNVPLLLLCVVIMSFGMILSRPGEKIVSANLADPAARGSYLGLASVSLAIGGGLGNLTGGLIYDLGERIDHPEMPWILFGIIGLGTVTGLWRIRGSVQRAHNAMQSRSAGSSAKLPSSARSPRPAS